MVNDPLDGDIEILLVKGPIHYDVLLPLTPQVKTQFAFVETAGVPLNHPQARWLIVGWGGRAFYTTVGDYSDLTASSIWKGVTGDSSVLRFDVAVDVGHDPAFKRLRLTSDQFAALIVKIKADLANKTAINTQGFTQTNAFFPSNPRFHIFQTCNAWVGRQLRRAGVRFGLWTPLPLSVTLSWKLHHAR